MLITSADSGVQRRSNDVDPVGHCSRVGDLALSLTSANWPFTVIAPHIVLFLNSNIDRSGASVHWPTASLKISATVDISSSLRKLVDDTGEDLRQRRRGRHDA